MAKADNDRASIEALGRRILVLEKELAISHRNRARLEDVREKNQRMLETVNAELVEALDELKRTQASLIQSEKMAALGQLTSGIAHEIKNPLNFVNNFASLSADLIDDLTALLEEPLAKLEGGDAAEARELFATLRGNLEKISEHGGRADQIVKNMLAHSRQGPSAARPFELNELLSESLQLAYHGARARDSSFNIELLEELDADVGTVVGHPQELSRVFLNLIANGMYAATARQKTETDATYAPSLKIQSAGSPDRVEIVVEDNGVGIPSELQKEIFAPFFTTKPPGEGTGLGLSISYDVVVKLHNGAIDVESEPGRYTRFRIALPRGRPPTEGDGT